MRRPPVEIESYPTAAIRLVVEAIRARDAVALAALMRPTQLPCGSIGGIGAAPECPGSAKNGTLVPRGTVLPVIPSPGCEGEWTTDLARVAATLVEREPELYAIVRLDQPIFTVTLWLAPFDEDPPALPTAEHAVILETSLPSQLDRLGFLLAVDDSGITLVKNTCFGPARMLIDDHPLWGSPEVLVRGEAFEE